MSGKSDPFDLSSGVPPIQGEMRPKPKFADRISKRVVFVVVAFAAIIIILFLASLDNMETRKQPASDKNDTASSTRAEESRKVPEELTGEKNQPGSSSLVGGAPPSPTPPTGATGTSSNSGFNSTGGIPPDNSDVQSQHQVPKLTPEQQSKEQEKVDRLARMRQAKSSGLSVKSFDTASTSKDQATSSVAPSVGPDFSVTNSLLNAARNASGQLTPQNGEFGGDQDEKLNFIRASATEDRSYHPHMAVPALSPNEVKAGALIPMTLEQGINSDLPGQVTARINQSVWDTVTGCRELIPPMTKAIGRYDSKVAFGQERNLAVWNGLLFPDGSELNMAGMEAYDTGGQAGLPADVDNHYFRTFGVALGISLVGAGVQLSIPQPNPATNGAAQQQTPSQIIAASLAQQYGALGAQILGKYLQVQPTLTNKPGERFVVMVPRTIIFNKVWRTRC